MQNQANQGASAPATATPAMAGTNEAPAREPRRIQVNPGTSVGADAACKLLEDISTSDIVAALIRRAGWTIAADGVSYLDYSMTERKVLYMQHIGKVVEKDGSRKVPKLGDSGIPVLDKDGKPVMVEETWTTRTLDSQAGGGSGIRSTYAQLNVERLNRAGFSADLQLKVRLKEKAKVPEHETPKANARYVEV